LKQKTLNGDGSGFWDSFFNKITALQKITARGSFVQRELSTKLTEGLFYGEILL